jgi:hypothetical protein
LSRRRSLSAPACIPIITATIGTQRVLHTASFAADVNRRYSYGGFSSRLCLGSRRRPQSDRSIRRGQQQQEECPVGFVIGSGSAAFTALHDHVPFGCTDAPVPFSAAPLQDHFKDWKSTVRHLKDWKLTIRHGNRDKGTSSKKLYTVVGGNAIAFLHWEGGSPRWATGWSLRCRNQDKLKLREGLCCHPLHAQSRHSGIFQMAGRS